MNGHKLRDGASLNAGEQRAVSRRLVAPPPPLHIEHGPPGAGRDLFLVLGHALQLLLSLRVA